MEIHVNDLSERRLKVLLDEEVGSRAEVQTFIDKYVEYYGLYAEGELDVTMKDRGLATRLCAEFPLPRLKAMLKDFFAMRQGRSDEGLRPDYRLVTFYNMRSVLVSNERQRRRDESLRKQMHSEAKDYYDNLDRVKKEREENPDRAPKGESIWARKERIKRGEGTLSERLSRRRGR